MGKTPLLLMCIVIIFSGCGIENIFDPAESVSLEEIVVDVANDNTEKWIEKKVRFKATVDKDASELENGISLKTNREDIRFLILAEDDSATKELQKYQSNKEYTFTLEIVLIGYPQVTYDFWGIKIWTIAAKEV